MKFTFIKRSVRRIGSYQKHVIGISFLALSVIYIIYLMSSPSTLYADSHTEEDSLSAPKSNKVPFGKARISAYSFGKHGLQPGVHKDPIPLVIPQHHEKENDLQNYKIQNDISQQKKDDSNEKNDLQQPIKSNEPELDKEMIQPKYDLNRTEKENVTVVLGQDIFKKYGSDTTTQSESKSLKDTVIEALDNAHIKAINTIKNKMFEGKHLLDQFTNVSSSDAVFKESNSNHSKSVEQTFDFSAKALQHFVGNARKFNHYFQVNKNMTQAYLAGFNIPKSRCYCPRGSSGSILSCRCCVSISLEVIHLSSHWACVNIVPSDRLGIWYLSMQYKNTDIAKWKVLLSKSRTINPELCTQSSRMLVGTERRGVKMPQLCSLFRNLTIVDAPNDVSDISGCVDFSLRILQKDISFYPVGCFGAHKSSDKSLEESLDN